MIQPFSAVTAVRGTGQPVITHFGQTAAFAAHASVVLSTQVAVITGNSSLLAQGPLAGASPASSLQPVAPQTRPVNRTTAGRPARRRASTRTKEGAEIGWAGEVHGQSLGAVAPLLYATGKVRLLDNGTGPRHPPSLCVLREFTVLFRLTTALIAVPVAALLAALLRWTAVLTPGYGWRVLPLLAVAATGLAVPNAAQAADLEAQYRAKPTAAVAEQLARHWLEKGNIGKAMNWAERMARSPGATPAQIAITNRWRTELQMAAVGRRVVTGDDHGFTAPCPHRH